MQGMVALEKKPMKAKTNVDERDRERAREIERERERYRERNREREREREGGRDHILYGTMAEDRN